jgi:F-type H+-transporting ATPase subunit c
MSTHLVPLTAVTMREEVTQIQWLGFALTEAVFFYGPAAGLIAYVL